MKYVFIDVTLVCATILIIIATARIAAWMLGTLPF